MKDFCDWWTPERIAAEDIAWQKERAWLEYGFHLVRVAREFALSSIWEFGCGAGYVGSVIPDDIYYYGSDASAELIELARQKFPQLQYQMLNVRKLPFNKGELPVMDLACSFAMLKHFSLDEWADMMGRMLQCGRYGLMHVQVLREEPVITSHPIAPIREISLTGSDNGIEFHHVYVTRAGLLAAIENAGHEYIRDEHVKPITNFPADEVMVLTRRK